MNAKDVRAEVAKSAERWQGQSMEIRKLVKVMSETSDVRNWLAHAWVNAPEHGDWVELQKPMKRSERWGVRRITHREVDQIASRFAWVHHAVTRILSEREWTQHGQVGHFVRGLLEPAALPAAFVIEEG